MKFKRPSTTDADRLLSYFCQLVELDSERVERCEDAQLLNHEKEVKWIEGLLKKEQAGDAIALCVLNEQSTIVGLGEVERRPRWIERHVAEIRFGLLPDHADAGIALVNLLEQQAKGIGIELLYYFHLASQSQGITVIEACGFDFSGVLPSYYKKGGAYIDRVLYAKKIT